MSSNTENSLNHCAKRRQLISETFAKILLGCVCTFAVAVIVLKGVLLIIINMKNPRFSLKEAEFNSSTNLTILSINPNKKLGIYYDDLVLHTSYKGERIAPEAFITPFYIDHGETKPVRASSVGNQQPLDPYLAYQYQQDQENGKVELEFKVTGNLRFKYGKYWYSETYCFTVKCPTIMKSEPKTPPSFTTQGTVVCSMK